MANIRIPFSTFSGQQGAAKFNERTNEVDLSGKSINEIDLSELVNTVELKLLRLDDNRLRNIELSSLKACRYIEQIWLGANELSSVDLTPLSECLRLRELHLYANELVKIDLLPLSSCRNLQSLWLSDNHLSDIDLSPLGECKRLKSVFLSGNQLKSVNLSTLLSIPLLQSVRIDPEVRIIAQKAAWKSRFKSDRITEDRSSRSIEFLRVTEEVQLYGTPLHLEDLASVTVFESETDKIQSGLSSKFTEVEHKVKTIMKEKPKTHSKQTLDETREIYKVALSYAGEQGEYVHAVAMALQQKGVGLFYDKFQKTEIWGQDLNEFLGDIYERKSEYCVLFISKEYAEKYYPTHEKKSAMSDKVKVSQGHILPVRFDDTDLPGLPSSIAYVKASDYNPVQLADLIATKVRD